MISRRRKKSLKLTGPLIVWLALQLIVLAVAAAGVPLAANWPKPPESFAVDEMLVAQLVFVSMLFPFLMRSVWSGVAVILTSLPMLQIAGFLSNTDIVPLLLAAGFLAAWVVALTLFRRVLHGRWCLVGVAIAMLYTVGGGVTWYVQRDFRPEAAHAIAFTPLPAAIALLHTGSAGIKPWWTVIIPLALAIAAVVISAVRHPTSEGPPPEAPAI